MLRPVRWSWCSRPDGRESCCTRRSATALKAISIAKAPRRSPGRIGQRVASEFCTVVDDGTIANRRGSLNVDDEGTPTSRTVLIEKGILRGYLQDRLNARLMKMEPTGNGRRESFAHAPMPRMTNTFMLPGEHRPRGHYQVGQATACMRSVLAAARSISPTANSFSRPARPI